MFKRRGWIALSILLSVLVTSFLIGVCVQDASAQNASPGPPSQQLQAPPNLPASPSAAGPATQHKTTAELILEDIGSIAHSIRVGIAVTGVAPILAAIIAGFFAWAIAEFYTKRLKRIEATLEFSKRFHELIQQQRALNRKQAEDKRDNKSLLKIEEEEAYAWWWQFFDLLLYEFDFWRRGLVRDQRFLEWMLWRWHDAYPKSGREWTTCGVSYIDGWERWRTHPAHGSPLIELISSIHAISKDTGAKEVEEKVRGLVKQYNPRWRK